MKMKRSSEPVYAAIEKNDSFGTTKTKSSFDSLVPSDIELAEIESENKKSKKRTKHFLDRKDWFFYAAYLRRMIYKANKGKRILLVQSDMLEIFQNKLLFKSKLESQNVMTTEVYFKEVDSQKRNLTENISALLQIYDFVAIQNEALIYGNFSYSESPKTALENIQNDLNSSEKTENELEQLVFDN